MADYSLARCVHKTPAQMAKAENKDDGVKIAWQAVVWLAVNTCADSTCK